MLMQLQNFVIFRLSCTNNLSCQKLQHFSLRANAEQVALSGVPHEYICVAARNCGVYWKELHIVRSIQLCLLLCDILLECMVNVVYFGKEPNNITNNITKNFLSSEVQLIRLFIK